MFSGSSQTPIRIRASVPPGHIIVNEKWRKSLIVTPLQVSATVVYQDEMGVVDFYTSSNTAVVYVSENDLIVGSMYKRKLVKLRKNNNVRGIVIAEKTNTSSQYFPELQKFCVLELGLTLFPIHDQSEAGQLLGQMVVSESRLHSNPFKVKNQSAALDPCILNTVRLLPSVGDVKARTLLNQFHSIKGICDASIEDLSVIVGKANAQQIKRFFTGPTGSATFYR